MGYSPWGHKESHTTERLTLRVLKGQEVYGPKNVIRNH